MAGKGRKTEDVIRDVGSFREFGEVRPDGKKRIVLKGRPVARHYRIYRNDKGQILLDPQIMIPASSDWLYSSKEALRWVKKNLHQET